MPVVPTGMFLSSIVRSRGVHRCIHKSSPRFPSSSFCRLPFSMPRIVLYCIARRSDVGYPRCNDLVFSRCVRSRGATGCIHKSSPRFPSSSFCRLPLPHMCSNQRRVSTYQDHVDWLLPSFQITVWVACSSRRLASS